jgi:hypothetical protein
VHLSFVNIRENAGWSRDARKAGAEDRRVARGRRRAVAGFSAGQHGERRRHLIYGRDEKAIEAAELLARSSRHHRADHAAAGIAPRASRISGGEGHDARAKGISARSKSRSTISRPRRRPRVGN